MDRIGKINRGRVFRQLFDRSLWREDIDNIMEQFEFDGIHELTIVRQVALPFDELPQPPKGFAVFILDTPLLLIFPMRRNPVFGHAMHFFRSDLEFDMLTLGPDHGGVERLIQIGFWNGDVVLETAWKRAPQRVDHAQQSITVHLRIGNDPQGGEIVDLFE